MTRDQIEEAILEARSRIMDAQERYDAAICEQAAAREDLEAAMADEDRLEAMLADLPAVPDCA